MVKAERSMESVNSLLFDDNAQEFSAKEHDVNSKEHETSQRLLKQKSLSIELEKLDSVPYYKRPVVQTVVLLAFAIPVGWGLISAFSTEETPSSQYQSTNYSGDREKQLLKESLEQERKKNQDLAVENGLKTQHLQVIPVKPKPAPKPRLQPTARPAVREQTSPVYKMPAQPQERPSRPILYSRASNASMTRSNITRKTKAQPKPDPMQQWLLASKAGSYGSSPLTHSQNMSAMAGNNPIDTDPNATQERLASTTKDNSNDWQPTNEVGSAMTSSNAASLPRDPELVTRKLPTLTIPQSNSISTASNYSTSINNLVAGTETSGKLLTKITWRSNNLTTKIRKPIEIELTNPLKDRSGVSVLPKGTIFLAKVDETNVEQIKLSVVGLKYAARQPELIPEGTILILNQKTDDEWLQAKIPSQNHLGRDLGMVVLSQLSNAQGATGEILRQVHDRTLFNRLERTESNFFVLPQGTKVRVYVNGFPETYSESDNNSSDYP